MFAERKIEITPSIDSPPLSGLVSGQTAGRLADDNLFRRYAGSLVGRFRINGIEETVHKRVLYEIGRVTHVKARALRNGADSFDCLSQAISTSELVMTDLVGACRRYTATPPTFTRVDLSAVGEKLGRALAAFVQFGTLTCGEIRGNRPINIRTLSMRDSPVNPALGDVMVSRSVDTVGPGVFAVLAAAINGCGSNVYTDEVMVDVNNRIVITEPTNIQCALSCVMAMHVLLSMYEDCGEGSTMAYAIMRGCHAVASVVGHSDEGGYMRDCLRSCGFMPPYGGITKVGTGMYVGLPMPTLTSESTFVALLDSILLGTAGLFARADPLVNVNGNFYPTVFYAGGMARLESGAHADVGDAEQNDIAQQIALNCHSMTINYVTLLGELFMTTGGNVAQGHLQRSISTTGGTRHTRFSVVAPYFWIEPTTLYKQNGRSMADQHGFGVIAGTFQSAVTPYFEQVVVTHTIATDYMAAVKQRTMRTSGIVIALLDNPLNGLGAMVPRQYMVDRAMMKGGGNTFIEALMAGNDLASYHWARQQNSIPHPAAFIYTGASMGIKVSPVRYSEADNEFKPTHAPTAADLMGEITWVSRSPARIGNGPTGWRGMDRGTRRARSTASESLANARANTLLFSMTGGEVMAVGNYEPLTVFPPSEVNAQVGEAVRGQQGPVKAVDEISVGPPIPAQRFAGRQQFQPARPAGNTNFTTAPVAPVPVKGGPPPDPAGEATVQDAGSADPMPDAP